MSKRARPIWGLGMATVVLIVLLVTLVIGLFWTINLIRFGLPPPTGQDCGSILHTFAAHPISLVRADASMQVLTCFWTAYQPCRAATISQTFENIDVWYTDTVTIERRYDQCVVYGHEENRIGNKGTNTFLCKRLSKEGDTLQLADCDGITALKLEPRDLLRESYLCGTIDGSRPYGVPHPQQVEQCFLSAYGQCLDGVMQYDTLENVLQVVEVKRYFFVDNHCGIAYLRYPTTATPVACASVEQQADGLHFRQCGAEGDIFVPSAATGSSL